MYGGNDKSLDEIISEVKQTVIGQDDAVEWLCAFVDAACTRSRIMQERGIDSLSLPNIGSALLVGPTASGKSHLVKTFARAAGLLYHSIDAGQMSAEGYKGNNFSAQWEQVSAKIDANPGRNALVFIDETDKLFMQKREGWAAFDLLKPLEGGKLSGMSPNGKTPWELDCDRCVFVLAGAFTGIEDIVSRRLGAKAAPIGFAAPEASCPASLSESDLRAQISLDDIEQWGTPREIVGRLSTVKFLGPLGEDALRMIVRNNKQDEYSAMLPGNARFSIDPDAEDVLVRNALAANYGARAINQQLNGLFCGKIWRATEAAGAVASVTLTACGNELDFRIEEAASARSADNASPEEDRLSAKAAYGLLREVRRCLKANGGKPALDPCATLGEDCSQYAAALLCKNGGVTMRESGPCVRNDFSLAEITLLYALVSMLGNWFPASDCTPQGLRYLLSLADPACPGKSPLDLMFYQLESGKIYIPDPDQDDPDDPSSREWVWADSSLVRNKDGLRPAEKGGLLPGEDEALDYYSEFKEYPRESRQQAVGSLAFRLL